MGSIRAGVAAAWLLFLTGCPQADPDPCADGGKPLGTPAVPLGVDVAVANEGATHVPAGTQVAYQHIPPASGSHYPQPAEPGVYGTALDDEQWVHNLEHGYVVLIYDAATVCGTDTVSQLESLAGSLPASAKWGYAKIVVTPYDALPEGVLITAIAWDVQLYLDRFDEAALRQFYGRYLDQGPEDAP